MDKKLFESSFRMVEHKNFFKEASWSFSNTYWYNEIMNLPFQMNYSKKIT